MACTHYGAWEKGKACRECFDALKAEVARLTRERDEWKTEAKEYTELALAPDGMLWRQRCKQVEAEVERLRAGCSCEARADVERLRAALLKRGLSPAPCDICGYNGPGYHQSNTHSCAALLGEGEK
jgi:hypothetical protein